MRFTTLIDITEYPQIWKSQSATRLYILLTLKCGYHDDDRDLIRLSLHTMEAEAGLSFSAVRHALKILMKAGLLVKENDGFRVTKWCAEKKITERSKKTGTAVTEESQAAVREAEQNRERLRRNRAEAISRCSAEQLRTWINEIESGTQKRHFGVLIPKSDDWLNYMKTQLEQK